MEKAVAKKHLDDMKTKLKRIQNDEWGDRRVYQETAKAASRISKMNKLLSTPERPDTCDGFIGDCNRKPSRYYDLKDLWLCISCYNEMADHYSS